MNYARCSCRDPSSTITILVHSQTRIVILQISLTRDARILFHRLRADISIEKWLFADEEVRLRTGSLLTFGPDKLIGLFISRNFFLLLLQDAPHSA